MRVRKCVLTGTEMWVRIVSPVHFALSIYVNRNFPLLISLEGEEGAGQGKSITFCQFTGNHH